MKKISRLVLNKRTQKDLAKKDLALKNALMVPGETDITKLQEGYRLADVERKLKEMQAYNGNILCCYCETKDTNGGFDIEHVKPKKKAGYEQYCFNWNNLLFACKKCNNFYKKENYEEGFLNPSDDDYIFDHHFAVKEDCFLNPETEEAKINDRILEMNTKGKHPIESRLKLKLDLIDKLERYKKANLPEVQISEFINMDFKQRGELPTFGEWLLQRII